jgi:hypothetical protein
MWIRALRCRRISGPVVHQEPERCLAWVITRSFARTKALTRRCGHTLPRFRGYAITTRKLPGNFRPLSDLGAPLRR